MKRLILIVVLLLVSSTSYAGNTLTKTDILAIMVASDSQIEFKGDYMYWVHPNFGEMIVEYKDDCLIFMYEIPSKLPNEQIEYMNLLTPVNVIPLQTASLLLYKVYLFDGTAQEVSNHMLYAAGVFEQFHKD